jgi:tetratricopeptide (TPR) repeat protein
MKNLTTLETEANQLLSKETPSLSELRRISIEFDDFIHSDDFAALEADQQEQLQELLRDIHARIRELSGAADLPSRSAGGPSEMLLSGSVESGQPSVRQSVPERSPEIARSMDEAEKLFYAGRYGEAVRLYDQVLEADPDWERARQHRSEADNYLRTGYIPSVALPAEAATAYGKAQSASRLGRYGDAQALLEKAKTALRESGIQRWQEGQEFEQKLQQMIDAESAYQEGIRLFSQGMLDEGIEKVDAAAQVGGLPKYRDKAQEMRKTRENLRSISEVLNSSQADARLLIQARSGLEVVTSEYGDFPPLQKLRTRLDMTLPRVLENLQTQARALITQAEKSQGIDAANTALLEARKSIEQIRSLSPQDDPPARLQNDLERLTAEMLRYEEELEAGLTNYEQNHGWPARASRLSQNVRRRFPNDPRVVQLSSRLGRYHLMSNWMRGGVILVGVVFLVFLSNWAFGRVQAMMPTATPTITATATVTATATATATATPTATATATPTNTPTATITPTPQIVILSRTVWARHGCYESFMGIGRIPEGAAVRSLPTERRFDSLNRECMFVEYAGPTNTIIGWILLADLEP